MHIGTRELFPLKLYLSHLPNALLAGIAFLLNEALGVGQNNSKLLARYALSEARNPHAIPILVKGIRDQRADNLELIISGEALAAMGIPEATKAIIEWAKGADSDVATLVKPWLSKMRDEGSIKLVKYTLENNEPFKSDAVKKAVKEGLDFVDSH